MDEREILAEYNLVDALHKHLVEVLGDAKSGLERKCEDIYSGMPSIYLGLYVEATKGARVAPMESKQTPNHAGCRGRRFVE